MDITLEELTEDIKQTPEQKQSGFFGITEFGVGEDISPRTKEQKERQRKFLEEQEDTTEFLTPTGNISPDPIEEQKTISVDKPTETPIKKKKSKDSLQKLIPKIY